MADYAIKYNPETVVCGFCKHETPAQSLQKRSGAISGISALKKFAENVKRWNGVFRELKGKRIDAFTFYFKLERISMVDERDNTQSSFVGGAEGTCANCGAILKAGISGETTIRRVSEPPTFDDFRGLPMPSDKVLSLALRSDIHWIGIDPYNEYMRLKRGIDRQTVSDEEKKEYARLDEEYDKAQRTPSSIDRIRALARGDQPRLEGFIKTTLANLEKVNVQDHMKNDFRTFLGEFRDGVRKTQNKEFNRFLMAMQRLAARRARL